MMHRKMSAMRDKSICMENRENGPLLLLKSMIYYSYIVLM